MICPKFLLALNRLCVTASNIDVMINRRIIEHPDDYVGDRQVMPVTETVTTSWFQKIKNALIGFVVGIILVLASIYFLFWNEGRSIETYRSLVEGAGLVIAVDSAAPDAANDGKLVHISGPVSTAETPQDQELGIAAPGALALVREVEMYQWVEKSESKTEDKLGGGSETTTTYSYAKEWKSGRENSSAFKESGHDNPEMLIEPGRFTVGEAAIGAYQVTGDQVAHLGSDSLLTLSDEDVARISDLLATGKPVQPNKGGLYVGFSESNPQVGDLRVTFKAVKLADASMVGKQSGNTLSAYQTSNGREILLSAAGKKDAAAMFKTAQDENALITWLIRIGGLVAMFIGFAMMFSIFGAIADVIPALGSVVGFGTGLIALVLTLLIGPVTIAIGWFAYRPLLAGAIILVGLAIAAGIIMLKRKGASAAAAPAAQG